MGREHDSDFHLSQPLQDLLLSDSRRSHPSQGSEKRSGLSLSLRRQLRGAAPTFAMISLSQVRQLEVDGESLRHPVRLIDVETVDYAVRAIRQLVFMAGVFLRSLAPCVQFTAFDKQRSQFLNRYEEFVSNLFFQHLSEQTAQRTHIATQRRLLQIVGVADQLSQPRGLIVNFPESFPSLHDFIPRFRKNIIRQLDDTASEPLCG
jgi:hypothetical protein